MAPRKDGTAREAGAISLSQVSTNFGHSTARLRRIKKIQFGIINPEELKQYSVTQAITVNGRKIPAGITRYEVCIYCCFVILYSKQANTRRRCRAVCYYPLSIVSHTKMMKSWGGLGSGARGEKGEEMERKVISFFFNMHVI
jgi:hypothetical protein